MSNFVALQLPILLIIFLNFLLLSTFIDNRYLVPVTDLNQLGCFVLRLAKKLWGFKNLLSWQWGKTPFLKTKLKVTNYILSFIYTYSGLWLFPVICYNPDISKKRRFAIVFILIISIDLFSPLSLLLIIFCLITIISPNQILFWFDTCLLSSLYEGFYVKSVYDGRKYTYSTMKRKYHEGMDLSFHLFLGPK